MTNTYTIRSSRLSVTIEPWGARMRSLTLDGGPNLILDADPHAHPDWVAAYGGVLIGPIANRVRGGQLTMGNTTYQMPQNEGTTCLHSGPEGVHAQTWEVSQCEPQFIQLTLKLADGDCGLPGNREITALFAVIDNVLRLSIHAISDAPTPFAFAHHPYWALGGAPTLQCNAETYLPIDDVTLPTGEVAPVAETPFDFRTPRPLPPEIDHNLCLSDAPHADPTEIATLSGETASLTISSTEPGLQVYSGAGLPTIENTDIAPFAGCALEPQAWPNAVNVPHFPAICTENYRQITTYRLAAT